MILSRAPFPAIPAIWASLDAVGGAVSSFNNSAQQVAGAVLGIQVINITVHQGIVTEHLCPALTKLRDNNCAHDR